MNDEPDNSESPQVDAFGCSRIGNDREENGDQFIVAELKRAANVHHASVASLDHSRRFGENQAHVLLVADGVSGQPGARNASGVIVHEIMESILNAVPWTQDLDLDSEADLRRVLKDTVVRCNERVSAAARETPARFHMASTLTMAFVRWPTAFVVHAGDSRAYLLRDGGIEQLTTDHTFAQQLVEDGYLDPEAAESSRFASMLWNAIGGDSRVKPELTVTTLEPGDSLLLCSDGLTGYLEPDRIRDLVESGESVREICEELVDTVANLGGLDDVTVAMARFGAEAESTADTLEMPTRDVAKAARPPRATDSEAPTRPVLRPQVVDSSAQRSEVAV